MNQELVMNPGCRGERLFWLKLAGKLLTIQHKLPRATGLPREQEAGFTSH